MHFVDDEHLIGCAHRRRAGHGVDFADGINAGIGCRVHFHDIDMGTGNDLGAVDTLFGEVECRVRTGFIGVIEGAGKNSGSGGFSHAAHTRQDESVVDATGRKGVAQRLDHRVLPHKALKARWPVFPGQNLIGRCWGLRGHHRGPLLGETAAPLPNGDPVGERFVRHQPPVPYVLHRERVCKWSVGLFHGAESATG